MDTIDKAFVMLHALRREQELMEVDNNISADALKEMLDTTSPRSLARLYDIIIKSTEK